jgi:DNA-binding transcriptional ArsR family regulator
VRRAKNESTRLSRHCGCPIHQSSVYGDLVEDGVRGVHIAQKLGVSHPTVSEHVKVLSQASLIKARRIKQWRFYKRDEAKLPEFKARILTKI